MGAVPRIERVQARGRFHLLVRFQNGEEKLYNCEPLLSRPQFHLLNDPAFFRAVHVDPGGYGVSWNDNADLSEYELWTNGIPILSVQEHFADCSTTARRDGDSDSDCISAGLS